MPDDIFFNGWTPLLRTLVISILAYPAMLAMIRLSGHRTLAQLNAFDLIITVAMGSTLASVITSADVALAQGILTFALLVSMQFALAWSTRRSQATADLVKGEPVLLALHGKCLEGALRRARLTPADIEAAVRAQGIASLAAVDAVVLETNGSLSVVQHTSDSPPGALEQVPGYAAGPADAVGPDRQS